MAKRVSDKETESPPAAEAGGGLYFPPTSKLQFIHSGAAVLNEVISGGWPLGRISNIVGDKSTGKTLLAIEASANFARTFPRGKIFYRESEAAFSKEYAAALGMPIDRIDFGDDLENPVQTAEDFGNDIEAQVEALGRTEPALYILDSLDALSDKAELERKMGEGTYGTGKPKAMSELFRKLAKRIEASNMHLMIISQIRDSIGMTFGKKYKRSGGHALDFYASQVVYLSHLKIIKKTVDKIEREIGVRIRARCEKNKVGLPYRECEFEILFNYGIDDLMASLEWLEEVGRTDALGAGSKVAFEEYTKETLKLPADEYRARVIEVSGIVNKVWAEVETKFLPTLPKKH